MKQDKKIFDSELRELWQSGVTKDQLDLIIVGLDEIGSVKTPPALLRKILDYGDQKFEKSSFLVQFSRPVVAGLVAAIAAIALFVDFSPSARDFASHTKQDKTDALVALMLDDEAPFDDIFLPDLILLEELS